MNERSPETGLFELKDVIAETFDAYPEVTTAGGYCRVGGFCDNRKTRIMLPYGTRKGKEVNGQPVYILPNGKRLIVEKTRGSFRMLRLLQDY